MFRPAFLPPPLCTIQGLDKPRSLDSRQAARIGGPSFGMHFRLHQLESKFLCEDDCALAETKFAPAPPSHGLHYILRPLGQNQQDG